MPPKSSSDNLDYKKKIKLELDKLKNGDIQKVKVDLHKFHVKQIAKRIGAIRESVKMYMFLPTAKRFYALNDRTINLLMKGKLDMSVGTVDGGGRTSDTGDSFSDEEAWTAVIQEQEVELFVVDKNRTRAGGSFFPYLNKTIFDLSKYGMFKTVDKNNYKHNCLYLALKAGGITDDKLQELILTMRNRHIHKCDLENVCNALEIHIELISLRIDGKCNVEHYGKDFDEKYNVGLVKGHYFINDYTEVTAYSLENYDEIKDIKDCNKIYRKINDKYKRGSDKVIKAFQMFKIMMENVDKLITEMQLTDEVLDTQFYDKIDAYNTLEYNKKNCRLE
jgi:hypothetical protein